MSERWNLTQTWAWIRWRDHAKVAAFAREAHLGLAEAMMYPDGSAIVEDGHRQALLEALRAGRIAATGIAAAEGAGLTAVPREAWAAIEPVAPSEARGAVAGNRRVAWRSLSFAAADVQRLWPGLPSRAGMSLKA